MVQFDFMKVIKERLSVLQQILRIFSIWYMCIILCAADNWVVIWNIFLRFQKSCECNTFSFINQLVIILICYLYLETLTLSCLIQKLIWHGICMNFNLVIERQFSSRPRQKASWVFFRNPWLAERIRSQIPLADANKGAPQGRRSRGWWDIWECWRGFENDQKFNQEMWRHEKLPAYVGARTQFYQPTSRNFNLRSFYFLQISVIFLKRLLHFEVLT